MAGKDRDKELDELQKKLEGVSTPKPFIERPPQLDTGNGALCWMDGSRRCGGDCVAFNAEEGLDPSGEPVDSPNKCIIIKYMGQQGAAGLSIIAMSRTAAKAALDERRNTATGGTPPIPPVGKKEPK